MNKNQLISSQPPEQRVIVKSPACVGHKTCRSRTYLFHSGSHDIRLLLPAPICSVWQGPDNRPALIERTVRHSDWIRARARVIVTTTTAHCGSGVGRNVARGVAERGAKQKPRVAQGRSSEGRSGFGWAAISWRSDRRRDRERDRAEDRGRSDQQEPMQ